MKRNESCLQFNNTETLQVKIACFVIMKLCALLSCSNNLFISDTIYFQVNSEFFTTA